MPLSAQQQKAKVFLGRSDFSVGATVSTGTKQTSMQECKTKISPVCGASLVEQARVAGSICQPL